MTKYLVALAAAAFLMGISPVRAQNPSTDQAVQPDQPGPATDQQAPTSADPNAPGMARVSFIHGSVSTQRGDNGEWVPAIVNTPVAVGDRISTGPEGRAEIQLDYADVLRMSSSATAKVAQMNRNTIQIQVGQGLVTYTVMKDGQAAPEIDTPNASLHPSGPGEYRILVNSDAETEITVRSGSAQVSTPQGSTDVNSGQMISVAGTDNPQYKIANAPASDEWDSWNEDRNQKIEDAQSWHNTDPYYTGSGDLDGYGTWSEVPDYGQVWIPSEPAGWAPYRAGRWVYEPYYGWTWVSYEPWGWAPYHYGRWFVSGGNWVWWPGPVAYNPFYYPVWAPAYVSFFGWGGGGWDVGVGFGFGGFGTVGWLPCGPGDWYHPWYGRWGGDYRYYDARRGFGDRGFHDGFSPLGHGRDGFSNFNDAARNGRVRAGFSSMEGRNFGRGAVPMNQERISASRFSQARMVGGRMPFTPTRASYSPTGRGADARSFRSAPPASQHFFNGGNRNAGFNRGGANSFARGRSPASNGSRGSFRAMNSNGVGSRGAITSSRSGWRNFTPPSGNSRSGFQGNRGAVNSGRGSFGNRSGGSSFGGTANRGGNWQHFTPQARQAYRPGGGAGYGGNQQRGYQGRGYQGQSDPYRGGYSNGRGSRPPLNMHQPIVQPRGGNGGYGRSPYGGRSRGYSAPRGGYSAPRGGSGYRGGGGGSRGGGGGYRGGGGGASRGGGGGYRGGGGGGSRGGGGGHSGGGGHGGGHGR